MIKDPPGSIALAEIDEIGNGLASQISENVGRCIFNVMGVAIGDLSGAMGRKDDVIEMVKRPFLVVIRIGCYFAIIGG
jgi:hypothetical protein